MVDEMEILEKKYTQPLKISQIVEAFPDECKKIVPKLYNKLNREYKKFREKRKQVYSSFNEFEVNDPFDIKSPEPISESYDGKVLETMSIKMFENQCRDIELEKSLKRLRLIKQYLEPDKKDNITEGDIESVKSIPILSLYEFEKTKTGYRRFSACCPFHSEKTPSFFVFENNSYYCFGCHAHGDSIEFVMQRDKINFVESVKLLRKML